VIKDARTRAFRTIRSRFRASTALAAGLGAIILVSLGLGLAALDSFASTMRDDIMNRNRLVAAALAGDIDAFLDGYGLALGLLGDAQFGNQAGVDALERLYPAFGSVLLVGEGGRVRFASKRSNEAYFDVSMRDFFARTARSGSPYLSPSFIAEGDYAPTAVLAVPVHDGVAAGYLSFTELGEYIAGLPVQGGESIAVADGNGFFVAHAEPGRVARRESVALEDWYLSGDRGSAGSGVYARPWGEDDLVCWAPVARPAGWIIIVSQDAARVFAPVNGFKAAASVVVAALGLFALAVIIVVLGLFEKDIKALRRYTTAVAEGRYDAEFDYRGFQDLARLADDYRAAAAAVKQRETLIQEDERRLELLLQEVHHRVKNNLQLIISLLALESGSRDDTEDVFSDSIDRIRVMATIHETLYESNDFSRIDFSEYIASIVERIASSYAYGNFRPRLALDLAAVDLDIDAAVPCGLIVNELFTNAIKYAFDESTPDPVVSVALAADEAGTITLSVADNGKGLPGAINPATAESLGLRLIVSLVAQLHGEWNMSAEGGTAWVIRFARPRADA